jgi:hypothetical protein
MTNHKKVAVLARELSNRLQIRLAALATPLFVFQTFDATYNALIGIAPSAAEAQGLVTGVAGTAGHQDAVIRIAEMPSIGTNAVGNAQDSYGPHVLEMALEATAASAAVSLLQDINKLSIWGESMRLGPRFDLYIRANGTAPSTTDLPSTPGKQSGTGYIGSFEWLYFQPLLNM